MEERKSCNNCKNLHNLQDLKKTENIKFILNYLKLCCFIFMGGVWLNLLEKRMNREIMEEIS